MTLAEKVQALHLWTYPVIRHMALHFFPSDKDVRHANMAMRTTLGIRNWDVPTSHWQREPAHGGYSLGTAGDCALRTHSLPFVRLLHAGVDAQQSQHFRALRAWAESQAPSYQVDFSQLVLFSWYRLPREEWPLIITSSIAFSPFRTVRTVKALSGTPPSLVADPARMANVVCHFCSLVSQV